MNMGRLNATMEETLSGERAVIAFNQQERVLHLFDSINIKVRDTGIQAMTYALTRARTCSSSDQARSKRSRFITLFHAATKS
jgi:hypothetical protein